MNRKRDYLTDGAKLHLPLIERMMTTPAFCPNHTSRNPEWFAVHTWSKHEKSVFEQLRSKQVETFLPLYHSSKRWRNGQQGSPLPLFPGYLFVRIDLQDRLPVLQTAGVARFVGFGQTPAPVPDDEIAQLELAVANKLSLSPHPFLTVGDRVAIKRGPLAGLTGILTREKQGLRVVLSVALISRSISVELSAADVECD
jgi:transcription termination/antitermination protein NusG